MLIITHHLLDISLFIFIFTYNILLYTDLRRLRLAIHLCIIKKTSLVTHVPGLTMLIRIRAGLYEHCTLY
jgi:hypothetical protein